MALAFVRGVSATFDRALCAVAPEPPIDVALARAQHAAYVDGLGWLGYRVATIAGDDAFPDGCFVEDTAVVADGAALVTRSAALERRGEAAGVAEALALHLRVHRMDAPATLDGGDVLLLGRQLFVGRSARTNDAGIARLADVFMPLGFEVVPVPVGRLLHLKCACSPLGEDRVLCAEGALPLRTFGAAQLISVPATEAYAANAVARADRVLVSAGHPRTRGALEAAGFSVRALDTTEVRKADGALTCLSLRLA